MKLIIDIPEEIYNDLKSLPFTTFPEDIIANGTPLPKRHGRLKDVDHYRKMEWEHPDYSLMDDEPTIIEATESEE